MNAQAPPINLNLTTCVETMSTDLALKARAALFAQDLAQGTAGFRVYKTDNVAVRMSAGVLLERLALGAIGFSHRVDETSLMAHGPGFFLTVEATGRNEQCTCRTSLWAETPERAAVIRAAIFSRIGDRLVDEPMRFIVDWRFLDAHGAIRKAVTQQTMRDQLLDEAYPGVPGGLSTFTNRYLEASESVLLLQGPPGTGKTRLIRGILGALSSRKGTPARAMYTSETKIFERDEFYMDFITGDHDVLLIEDADLLLGARADGNRDMHRFLNIADGIVQGQDRKIIFSTNLRNAQSIDEALVRPGRCFAHVLVRELTIPEARRLLERLCLGDKERVERAMQELGANPKVSLARVYAALRGSAEPPHHGIENPVTLHSFASPERLAIRNAG